MKITQVEPQKKNPRRFNVYLDGQFGFGADEDLVVERRLVIGKEIGEEDLEQILFGAEVGKWMEKMYRLFGVRMRSESEVRNYIRIKNHELRIKEKEELSELGIESLVERLKQKGLVDDRIFAKAWMEARRSSKKKGKNVIKMELYQKGIGREIIEEVMEGLSVKGEGLPAGRQGVSEEQLAREALEKKMRVWRNLEPQEFKKKAVEFLVRRGFDYEVANSVIENEVEN